MRLSGVESSTEVPPRGRLSVAVGDSTSAELDPSALCDAFPFRRCMKSYWKRLSCGYIDATGRRMDNGTELNIRGVRSTKGTPKAKFLADEWIATYLTPTYNLEHRKGKASHVRGRFLPPRVGTLGWQSLTMQPTRQHAPADIIDSEAGALQLKRSASRVLDDTLQVL